MSTKLMQRVGGLCNSTNPQEPLLALLEGPTWDEDGYQQAKRINGSVVCPKCDLVWPSVEDVEEWTEGPDGRKYASGWGTGYAVCEFCGLAIVEGFDCDYVLDLNEWRQV